MPAPSERPGARPDVDPEALPMQTRLATLGAVDVDNRTVRVVWTTGATVRRRRYSGWDTYIPFDEELLVTADAVDLTRLNAGAPVVDSHMTYSVSGQMAVVERAWLEGGEGLADIRFPNAGTDPGADRLFEKVRQKIVRNLSVGYTVNRVREVDPQKTGEVLRRIVESWTPFELSFVTVPADAGAQARNTEQTFPVEIVGRSAVGGSGAASTLARMKMRARAAGL